MVEVERKRSLADRMAGREGAPVSLTVTTPDEQLVLRREAHGVAGEIRQIVRGVTIKRRTVGVDEWLIALAGVLARALRRDPEERFRTMEAFAAALTNPEAAVASGEVTPGWTLVAGQRAATSWSASLDEPQSWRDWARYAAIAIATLMGLVLLGILATYFKPAG